MNNKKVILASQSLQRVNLLKTLRLKFEVIPANINEEEILARTAKKRVEKIARSKAEYVLKKYPKAIIIAADTFALLEGKMLEKPKDKKQAAKMLEFLSGKVAKDYTGFCYLDLENKIDYSSVTYNFVKFRNLSKSEIEYYVSNNPVTTWAGGFSAAYDAGMGLIAHTNGSLTTLTHGFPIEEVTALLKRSGVYK